MIYFFFLNVKKKKRKKVHYLMPICSYKMFTSLPENRNAILGPDAAGFAPAPHSL